MAALGQASETPERLWNMGMARTTAEEVSHLAASARLAQVLDSSTPLFCHGRTSGLIVRLWRLHLAPAQRPLMHSSQ